MLTALYIAKQKKCFLKKKKKVKIAKDHMPGYVSTYNVEILNSFNLELQLKDT